MNDQSRKPGDLEAHPGVDIAPDDPSIPVLTERLTLPPLELDLDFSLPPVPRNAAPVQPPVHPPLHHYSAQDSAAEMPLPKIEVPQYAPLQPHHSPSEVSPSVAAAAGVSTAALVSESPLPSSHQATPTQAIDIETVAPITDLLIPTSLRANSSRPMQLPPLPADDHPALTDPLVEENVLPPSGTIDRIELRESILLALASSLPQEVEAIVRQQMESAIDRAVKRLTADIRIAIAASIREILDRAVKAELEKLKGPSSG